MLICEYLSLRKGYLLIKIRISKYFILFYYHICLPQLIWNSFAYCKCASDRRGIVCAQVRPNWVAVGPVSTSLLTILGPNTTGVSPAWFNQKKAHHNNLNELFYVQNLIIFLQQTKVSTYHKSKYNKLNSPTTIIL